MNPHHHLDASTLISYASGALPQALATVASTHLDACAHCRQCLREADAVGGVLLEQQSDARSDALRCAHLRASMLTRLDDEPSGGQETPPAAAPASRAMHDPDALPAPLRPYFGDTFSALRWRWTAPGIHVARATRACEGSLFMLKIAPSKSMPVHSHGGSELTHILRGAYDDALGHFAPGDIADLDRDIQHQPVTTPGVPCICVAALDAPLRFPGWIARKLQPLVGL